MDAWGGDSRLANSFMTHTNINLAQTLKQNKSMRNLHKSNKVDKIGDTENQKEIYFFYNTGLSILFQSLFPHR
jgi:hypothetical protein